MTKTIEAIYAHGVVRPKRKLPFHEQAALKLVLTFPTNPVRRTRGIIRVTPRTARAIIYGTEADFYGA